MTDTDKEKPAPEGLPDKVVEELERPERLKALEELGLSGPGHDQAFDDLVARAAAIFEADFAHVALIDDKTLWIKSAKDSDAKQFPAETTFCAHTVAEGEPALVTLDATKDPRFADNPFVAGQDGIRFYIGCPISFRDQKIGTLCVYDSKPREQITAEQKRMLLDLSWDASRVVKTRK